jgi:hypothetical protein
MKTTIMKLSLALASATAFTGLKAQNPLLYYSNRVGSNAFNIETATAVKYIDNNTGLSDESVATGYFYNSITLGGTSLTSSGLSDAYVAKMNGSGTYQWAFKIGGLDFDKALTIDVDRSNGIIYVGGEFKGQVDFDPSLSFYYLTNTTANPAGFVAKYTLSGAFISAVQMGTSVKAISFNVGALFPSICVGGEFTGTTTFTNLDGTPGSFLNSLSSNGGKDVFLTCYSTTGTRLSKMSIGGPSDDELGAMNFLDRLYVSGRFSGTNVDFNPNFTLVNPLSSVAGLSNAFFACYSFTSDFSGITSFVYDNAFILGNGSTNVFPSSLIVNRNGRSFVTGYFTGTADFDPSSGVANLSSTNASAFIAEYSFTNLTYMHSMQLTSIVGESYGNGITWGGLQDDIYLTGGFSGTTDFNPSKVTVNLSTTGYGDRDAYVAKYDSALNFIGVFKIGNTSGGIDEGKAINIRQFDNCYPIVGGYFSGTNVDLTQLQAQLI